MYNSSNECACELSSLQSELRDIESQFGVVSARSLAIFAIYNKYGFESAIWRSECAGGFAIRAIVIRTGDRRYWVIFGGIWKVWSSVYMYICSWIICYINKIRNFSVLRFIALGLKAQKKGHLWHLPTYVSLVLCIQLSLPTYIST